MPREVAAIGLRVRTGRAVVVVLRGTRAAPEIVLRQELRLYDPDVPESMQPYHHELDDSGPAGTAARRRGCQAAQRITRRAIRALLGDLRSRGLDPRGAAAVVSSLVDPARIGGAHPRAHAEEGKLYREAVESALDASGLQSTTLLEKAVHAAAAAQLAATQRQLDAMLKTFAGAVGAPWRAYEKQAALAAWIALPKKTKR
jgi:hypothetical protein